MELITPEKLKISDKIGIIAPSSGLAAIFSHRTENGKKMLEELGFEVVFSKHALRIDGYVSASAKNRAEDIHEMFEDKSIKAIICTIGGDHANQILKYLDFELIKRNPKIFVGYSDITVLHYALAKKANLRTYYGPCLITEFGEFPEILPYTLEYFNKALINQTPMGRIEASETWTDEILDWSTKKDLDRPRKLLANKGYTWWREGHAKGKIFGGTIPSINHLAGTKYWIDLKNKIFFFDLPEGHQFGDALSLAYVDSYLADLDNMNFFKEIKGLIIGRPYRSSEDDISNLKLIIEKYTEGTDYPILFNANIGHASPIITIPLGAPTSLDSAKNLFEIF